MKLLISQRSDLFLISQRSGNIGLEYCFHAGSAAAPTTLPLTQSKKAISLPDDPNINKH